MHAFLIPHSPNQLGMRHWIKHILNVVLWTFILTSKHSSVHLLKNILLSSLQNLSLSIISDDCVLYALIYHFIEFINKSYHDSTLALTIHLQNITFLSCIQHKYGPTALLP